MSSKVVIAPNAFKNSLAAEKVAEALANGYRDGDPLGECVLFPVGDGGDGTGSLLAQHLKARRIPARVNNPLGDRIDSQFYLTDDHIAIIELADASGIRLLDRTKLDVMHSNTFGAGELIRNALDHGAKEIILCIGGSATIDAGTGILRAVGFRFLDLSGEEIEGLPSRLDKVVTIDASNADVRISTCKIKVLVDVQTVIAGEVGCARIFGPQKGATSEQIQFFDTSLHNLCDVVYRYNRKQIRDLAGGGAAGGVAALLYGLLNADIVNGIEYFLEVTNFENALTNATLVITGEGKLDDQTLEGKGPLGVARIARKKGVKVIGVAGEIDIHEAKALQYFDVLMPIQPNFISLNEAIANTYENLKATGKAIALKFIE